MKHKKIQLCSLYVKANGKKPEAVYGLLQAFFIEGDPHSYKRHIERVDRGERDIVPSAQDWGHADVASGKCASQATQAEVTLSWHPPPP